MIGPLDGEPATSGVRSLAGDMADGDTEEMVGL